MNFFFSSSRYVEKCNTMETETIQDGGNQQMGSKT